MHTENADTVLIWDLDKTYLDTRFESFRSFLKIAFETPGEKRAFRTAAVFLRELKRGMQANSSAGVNLTFLSASPPLLRETLRNKFSLDQLEVDAIVLKNLTRNLKPGRLGLLKNHLEYKLEHLLRLALLNPGRTYYCFGDDWEMDLLIYVLFRDLLRGDVDEDMFWYIIERLRLPENRFKPLWKMASQLVDSDSEIWILVHRVRYRTREILEAAGDHVVGYDSYLQVAVRAMQEGWLNTASAARLFEAASHDWNAEEAWMELASGVRSGTIRADRVEMLQEFLAHRIPEISQRLQQRLGDADQGLARIQEAARSRAQTNQEKIDGLLEEFDAVEKKRQAIKYRYDRLIDLLRNSPGLER